VRPVEEAANNAVIKLSGTPQSSQLLIGVAGEVYEGCIEEPSGPAGKLGRSPDTRFLRTLRERL
jgi:hypothetical protein